MKKVLFIIVAFNSLCLIAQISEERGAYETFYENGNVKSVLYGDFEWKWDYTGPIKFYYENGIVHSEGSLDHSEPSGVWQYYNENNKLKYGGEYKNGIKHGEWAAYDNKGNILFSERKHDFTNLAFGDFDSYDDKCFDSIKSQMCFSNDEGVLLPYSELENGISYRVITFIENEPDFTRGLQKKNKDVKITDYRWGYFQLKFRKKVKLILVDYYDQGCHDPETEFVFKNLINVELDSFKNLEFWSRIAIFNNPKILRKTKFFELTHCEGSTYRVIIIYE
tara:strand:+ start:1363 stop:2199 length:837 start_codon:yes stop_codon:yes gene_type:complete